VILFYISTYVYNFYHSRYVPYTICQKYYRQEVKARLVNFVNDHSNNTDWQFIAIRNQNDTFIYKSQYYMPIYYQHHPTDIGDSIYKAPNSFKTYIFKKKIDTVLIVTHSLCSCADNYDNTFNYIND
jgi:hypothetical protein